MRNCTENRKTLAGLAELVDALDSGSSVRKDFGVQVPGSALCKGLEIGTERVVTNSSLAPSL